MSGEGNIDKNYPGQCSPRPADSLIAELAGRQYGVVARWQLLDLGIDAWEIDYRLQVGRLLVLHRGVYAVGHRALTRQSHWIAAVLAVGPDAVLSHRSAGAHWGLLQSAHTRVDVTAPRRVRPPDGATTHRRALPADEVTVERQIPVTSVPRTLLDLAAVLDPRRVERAIEEAEARRLDDALSLRDLVERYPGRRGTAVVRAILDADQLGSTYTRSDLEETFLAFVRANSLPSPELNVDVEVGPGRWVEADCVWRPQRIVVELDSRRFHATRWAFERDRAKDRALTVAGWTVVRVTWRHLHDDPAVLTADLRQLLAAAA